MREPIGAAPSSAACCRYISYGLVLWAMTFAPIAGVSAFRETSVVFAALIGIIFFGEAAGPRRIVGAAHRGARRASC